MITRHIYYTVAETSRWKKQYEFWEKLSGQHRWTTITPTVGQYYVVEAGLVVRTGFEKEHLLFQMLNRVHRNRAVIARYVRYILSRACG